MSERISEKEVVTSESVSLDDVPGEVLPDISTETTSEPRDAVKTAGKKKKYIAGALIIGGVLVYAVINIFAAAGDDVVGLTTISIDPPVVAPPLAPVQSRISSVVIPPVQERHSSVSRPIKKVPTPIVAIRENKPVRTRKVEAALPSNYNQLKRKQQLDSLAKSGETTVTDYSPVLDSADSSRVLVLIEQIRSLK